MTGWLSFRRPAGRAIKRSLLSLVRWLRSEVGIAGDAPQAARDTVGNHCDKPWPVLAVLGVMTLMTFGQALFSSRVFFDRDIQNYWMPQIEGFVHALGQGSWPLWNPYFGFGQPMWADPGCQVLYPFTWLNLLILPATYHKLLVLSHVLATGLGCYQLARRFRVSPWGSAAAACAWAFSGPYISLVNNIPHFCAIAWLPWIVLLSERLLDRPSVTRASALSLAVVLQLFAGSGDYSVWTLCVVLLIAAATLVSQWMRRQPQVWRKFGMLFAALGMAALLSAAQWLPSLALMQDSARSSLDLRSATYWSVHPLAWIDCFLPRLLSELPLTVTWRTVLYEGREPFLASLYLGWPAMGLLVLALGGRWTRAHRIAFVTGGVAFWLSMGRLGGLYPLLARLPLLGSFRYPVKFMLLVAFFTALAVGLACDRFCSEWDARAKRRARALLFVLLAVAGGMWLASAWIQAQPERLAEWVYVPLPPARHVFAYVFSGVVFKLRYAAIAAVILAALLAERARRARPAAASAVMLIGLIAVDLAYTSRSINALAPRELLQQVSATQSYWPSREKEERVFVLADSPLALNRQLVRGPAGWEKDWAWALGLRDLLSPPIGALWRVWSSFDPDYTGLNARSAVEAASVIRLAQKRAAGLRLLQMSNVSRVISMDPEPFPGLERIASIDSVFMTPIGIYRVPEPVARLRVMDGVYCSAHRHLVDLLNDPAFDFKKAVALQGPDCAHRPADPRFVGAARLIERRPDRLDVAVEASSDAILLVNEAFDEGWVATIDGRTATVRRANFLFRAIEIPPGAHRVAMVYRPRSVRWGILLSGVGGMLAIIALIASRGMQSGARS